MSGNRGFGRPRTEAEREEIHKARFGEDAEVPPRGTGLRTWKKTEK